MINYDLKEVRKMASIFKRKDTGSWYVQWTHRGKLFREKVGKSKELAKIRLGEITRKKELGQLFVNTDMSLKDLMDRFKKSLQTDPLSERTRMRMENIFNNFEGYCKKENLRKLNQFDFTVLYEYITHRIIEDKIAPKTANMEISILKRIFNFAVKHRYMVENPADDLVQKKLNRKEPRYFNTEEIEFLLTNAGKYEPFFMVLLHTGLRASDAGDLRWSDIDLEKGLLRIIQEKTERRLTIPINDTLKNYLLDYATEGDQLFPDLNRDSRREKVRRFMQKLFREKGYKWKRVGCHTFRHTFASHLVINGASIYDVQKLLGHKSIYMTQIYAHLSENATRRAVDLLEFNPKSGINPVLIAGVRQRKGA